jgi:cold shock CspA family protein
VQATVLTFDADSRRGTVVTDDGVRLAMPAAALDGSGLRHLRPGQRVTCLRDGDTVTDVRIVGVSG